MRSGPPLPTESIWFFSLYVAWLTLLSTWTVSCCPWRRSVPPSLRSWCRAVHCTAGRESYAYASAKAANLFVKRFRRCRACSRPMDETALRVARDPELELSSWEYVDTMPFGRSWKAGATQRRR